MRHWAVLMINPHPVIVVLMGLHRHMPSTIENKVLALEFEVFHIKDTVNMNPPTLITHHVCPAQAHQYLLSSITIFEHVKFSFRCTSIIERAIVLRQYSGDIVNLSPPFQCIRTYTQRL